MYIRVLTSFYTNKKTLRLRARIGDAAYWVPPRLWAYAAENQSDGDFTGYSAEEIAMALAYDKDASSMLEALHQAGFMHAMRLHQWEEHNGFHATFKQRAKTAAGARWANKKASAPKKEPTEASAPKGSATKLSDEQFIDALKPLYPGIDVDQQVNKMRAWLMTHKGRQLTRQFAVNWLNKVDPPLKTNGHEQQQRTSKFSWTQEPARSAESNLVASV